MKHFIVKLSAAFLFLGCILLVENIMLGALPLLGGLLLLAICGGITLKVFGHALSTPPRRRHAPHRPAPALRAAHSVAKQTPGGPKAA